MAKPGTGKFIEDGIKKGSSKEQKKVERIGGTDEKGQKDMNV